MPALSPWLTFLPLPLPLSDVNYDLSANLVSFRTTHLAPLALLGSRCRLVPYEAWHIRPTGGRDGASAAVTLTCADLQEQIVFEVRRRSCSLGSKGLL